MSRGFRRRGCANFSGFLTISPKFRDLGEIERFEMKMMGEFGVAADAAGRSKKPTLYKMFIRMVDKTD